MALAERADLAARLTLDDQFSRKLAGANKALSGFGKGLSTAAGNIAKFGAAAAVGLSVAVIGAVRAGINSLSQLSTAQQQTAAVIASTGGVAKVTAAQIRTMAEALENVTTVDDKVIQSGQNMLLTFTNIGAKAFPQATKAMVDMAIAMNSGNVEGANLQATAIQIGKALNDPIKGVTALRKVGVALTKDQEKQIKAFMKAGKVYEAQQVILKELEKEFGNAGKAAGQDFGSDLRRLQDAGEDLTMALAKGLMPVLTRAAKWLNEKLADPRTQAMISKLGDKLAEAGGKLLDFIEKVDWGAIAGGLGKAKDAAMGIVSAFMAMPDWVKQAVIGGWGLNKLSGGMLSGLLSGVIKGVLGMNAGVVNINAGVVNGGGGAPGALGAAGGGAAAAAAMVLGPAALVIALVQAWNNPAVTEAIKGAVNSVLPGLPLAGKADIQNQSDTNQRNTLAIIASGDLTKITDALNGTKDNIASLTGLQRVLYDLDAAGNKTRTQETVAALEKARMEIMLANDGTESLLRQNLSRPQPAPIVNVSVNTRNYVTSGSISQAQIESDRYNGGPRSSGGTRID